MVTAFHNFLYWYKYFFFSQVHNESNLLIPSDLFHITTFSKLSLKQKFMNICPEFLMQKSDNTEWNDLLSSHLKAVIYDLFTA